MMLGSDPNAPPVVKAGGRLAVSISVAARGGGKADPVKEQLRESLDPALLNSWLEIIPTNTVLIRRRERFGQGSVYTAYRELCRKS